MPLLLVLKVCYTITCKSYGSDKKICGFYVGALFISFQSSNSTSLTISWSLAEGFTADTFTISYSNTNTDCFNTTGDGYGGGLDTEIMTMETMYTLTGLEEGTEYSITVTATLMSGEVEKDTITATTNSTG